jgi:hypothetical protein
MSNKDLGAYQKSGVTFDEALYMNGFTKMYKAIKHHKRWVVQDFFDRIKKNPIKKGEMSEDKGMMDALMKIKEKKRKKGLTIWDVPIKGRDQKKLKRR